MKGLVYMGPEDLRLMDRMEPKLADNQVLLKVKYCGICGSDMTMYAGKHTRLQPDTVLGHEFVGEVVEIRTDKQSDLKIGDYVAVEPIIHCHQCFYCKSGRYNLCHHRGVYGCDVDGGFAELVQAPLDKIIKLPKSGELKKMALIEPLAVAVSVANKCQFRVGDTVVVLGGGTIGLLVAQVIEHSAAGNVIVSEIDPYRLQKARALGLKAVNPNQDDLESRVKELKKDGADVVIDSVGHAEAIKTAFELVRRGGLINIVALYHGKVPVDLLQLVYSEIDLMGTFIYTYQDFITAKELLERELIAAEALITAVYPLAEAVDVFKKMHYQNEGLKTLIKVY